MSTYRLFYFAALIFVQSPLAMAELTTLYFGGQITDQGYGALPISAPVGSEFSGRLSYDSATAPFFSDADTYYVYRPQNNFEVRVNGVTYYSIVGGDATWVRNGGDYDYFEAYHSVAPESLRMSADLNLWDSSGQMLSRWELPTAAPNLNSNILGGFFLQGPGWRAQGQLTYLSNVAAVPEPETYAMMLAGLGLLGVMARRRKHKSAA